MKHIIKRHTITALLLLIATIVSAKTMPRGDPTRPPDFILSNMGPDNLQELDANFLKLNSIFYSNHDKKAIINQVLVREGDTILDKKIVKITPKQVSLKHEDGKISKLTMGYNSKKVKDKTNKNKNKSDQ